MSHLRPRDKPQRGSARLQGKTYCFGSKESRGRTVAALTSSMKKALLVSKGAR
jgi:hypothetical protein